MLAWEQKWVQVQMVSWSVHFQGRELCIMRCHLFSGALRKYNFTVWWERLHGYCKELDSVEKCKKKGKAAENSTVRRGPARFSVDSLQTAVDTSAPARFVIPFL